MENVSKIILNGITWDHSRGYTPMVATSQRFEELNPHIVIKWDKRSLQKFADENISDLASKYDLLVVDHPWAGYAAKHNIIVALNEYLPNDFLTDQQLNSVGKSFESYNFSDFQFAIPLDAAAPVSAYRPDLFQKIGYDLPTSIDDVLKISDIRSVVVPGKPIDLLMNFYTLCCKAEIEPFESENEVVDRQLGIWALELLGRLTNSCKKSITEGWSPIDVFEKMTTTDDFLYCPFAYGYSNYARKGYANYPLKFSNVISIREGEKTKTTLGGTGIAISSNTNDINECLSYLQYVTSKEIQAGLYFECGGQPARKDAWFDSSVNNASDDFFKDTYTTLEHSYLRPRYDGYMKFQDHAGNFIRDYLLNDSISEVSVLSSLNDLYIKSREN